MRKGEQTRERILARAAEVFNVRGAAGASLSDIMTATGLKKGGIYNHFGSKDELALASFDHAATLIERRFADVWDEEGLAALFAFVETFRDYATYPPLPGGCPLLNTAIDSDDTNPELRERARRLAAGMRERLRRAVVAAQARGEVRPAVDADELSTVMLATLEGGVMLSKLDGDLAHLQRAADHLVEHIMWSVRA
jgi:TetR/AcrR family transcriptional regulator, transcriptional repressor for nem operon